MAFPPQGFLLQPSLRSGLILGPRTEELRSSPGSAFAPYSGSSGSSSGFSSHLPYGGEPRTAGSLSSFMSPVYDPSSLDFHPFGAPGPFSFGDPSFRKSATRDATATLKTWLQEHRRNPYPTKGEKIMLAILTRMSLTQVSTWFANARRRLKKENRMTWTPRTRSEDEDDEDHLDRDRTDQSNKSTRDQETRSEAGLPVPVGTSCVLLLKEDTDHSLTDPDFKDSDRRSPLVPGPSYTGAPPHDGASPSKNHVDSCEALRGPAPKPKLWSLAEIATSSDKSKGCWDSSQSGGATAPRSLYYTPPFLPGYPGYSPLGPLGALQGHGSYLKGLQQRAEARDCKVQELKRPGPL